MDKCDLERAMARRREIIDQIDRARWLTFLRGAMPHADELILLGDPAAPKPQGVIKVKPLE